MRRLSFKSLDMRAFRVVFSTVSRINQSMRVSERGQLPQRLRLLVRHLRQRDQDDEPVRGRSQEVRWGAAPGH